MCYFQALSEQESSPPLWYFPGNRALTQEQYEDVGTTINSLFLALQLRAELADSTTRNSLMLKRVCPGQAHILSRKRLGNGCLKQEKNGNILVLLSLQLIH